MPLLLLIELILSIKKIAMPLAEVTITTFTAKTITSG